jgi:EAL domain-containing protein (putative c-di-GMP-specific phosphodiesterase class I)
MSPRKSWQSAPIYSLYQPIVEIGTKKVLGYEALTRGRGRHSLPVDLFRTAYEDGCVVELDFDCLDSACRILHQLKRGQLLFVNVEPMTLSQSFAKREEAEFLFRRISHHWEQIVFELTEGMKSRDFPFVKRGVHFLRKLGCRFAIDDISGVGAKLFQLLSLEPDFLKIDISLVKGLWKNPVQQGLVERLVDLGRKNHSKLIAEGVETKKDLDFIREMGIPYSQGYYLGRPKKVLLSRSKI